MTTTTSARGTPVPVRTPVRTAEAVPPTPSETVAAPAATPVRSWFRRIDDTASRMDACTEITAAHRDHWPTTVR